MGRDALELSDLIMDLNDAIENMYGDYGGVTPAKINNVRKLLDKLEEATSTPNK
jgi:hypothetical protein